MIRKDANGWGVYAGTNLVGTFKTKREAREADIGVKARQMEKRIHAIKNTRQMKQGLA